MASNNLPRVPEGLRDLIKNYTKEVLREKPTDLYKFSVKYFEGLEAEEKRTRRKMALTYEPQQSYDSIMKNRSRPPVQIPLSFALLVIPQNLTEVIKQFIKAVLKQNPQYLTTFAIEYFKKIQRTASCFPDINYSNYEKFCEEKKERKLMPLSPKVTCECGRKITSRDGKLQAFKIQAVEKEKPLTFDKSENYLKAVTIIQRHIRRYLRHKTTNSTKVESTSVDQYYGHNVLKSVLLIQRQFRRFLLKKTVKEQSEPAKQLIDSYSVNYIKSVHVIQRYIRKHLKKKQSLQQSEVSTSSRNISFNGAAFIIQRAFRKYNKLQKAKSHINDPDRREEINDIDSEAASYTSASTALLSTESVGDHEIGVSNYDDGVHQQTIEENKEVDNENAFNQEEYSTVLSRPSQKFIPPNENGEAFDIHVKNNYRDEFENAKINKSTKKINSLDCEKNSMNASLNKNNNDVTNADNISLNVEKHIQKEDTSPNPYNFQQEISQTITGNIDENLDPITEKHSEKQTLSKNINSFYPDCINTNSEPQETESETENTYHCNPGEDENIIFQKKSAECDDLKFNCNSSEAQTEEPNETTNSNVFKINNDNDINDSEYIDKIENFESHSQEQISKEHGTICKERTTTLPESEECNTFNNNLTSNFMEFEKASLEIEKESLGIVENLTSSPVLETDQSYSAVAPFKSNVTISNEESLDPVVSTSRLKVACGKEVTTTPNERDNVNEIIELKNVDPNKTAADNESAETVPAANRNETNVDANVMESFGEIDKSERDDSPKEVVLDPTRILEQSKNSSCLQSENQNQSKHKPLEPKSFESFNEKNDIKIATDEGFQSSSKHEKIVNETNFVSEKNLRITEINSLQDVLKNIQNQRQNTQDEELFKNRDSNLLSDSADGLDLDETALTLYSKRSKEDLTITKQVENLENEHIDESIPKEHSQAYPLVEIAYSPSLSPEAFEEIHIAKGHPQLKENRKEELTEYQNLNQDEDIKAVINNLIDNAVEKTLQDGNNFDQGLIAKQGQDPCMLNSPPINDALSKADSEVLLKLKDSETMEISTIKYANDEQCKGNTENSFDKSFERKEPPSTCAIPYSSEDIVGNNFENPIIAEPAPIICQRDEQAADKSTFAIVANVQSSKEQTTHEVRGEGEETVFASKKKSSLNFNDQLIGSQLHTVATNKLKKNCTAKDMQFPYSSSSRLKQIPIAELQLKSFKSSLDDDLWYKVYNKPNTLNAYKIDEHEPVLLSAGANKNSGEGEEPCKIYERSSKMFNGFQIETDAPVQHKRSISFFVSLDGKDEKHSFKIPKKFLSRPSYSTSAQKSPSKKNIDSVDQTEGYVCHSAKDTTCQELCKPKLQTIQELNENETLIEHKADIGKSVSGNEASFDECKLQLNLTELPKENDDTRVVCKSDKDVVRKVLAAIKIQKAFRRYLANSVHKTFQSGHDSNKHYTAAEVSAARKIQNSFRDFIRRKSGKRKWFIGSERISVSFDNCANIASQSELLSTALKANDSNEFAGDISKHVNDLNSTKILEINNGSSENLTGGTYNEDFLVQELETQKCVQHKENLIEEENQSREQTIKFLKEEIKFSSYDNNGLGIDEDGANNYLDLIDGSDATKHYFTEDKLENKEETQKAVILDIPEEGTARSERGSEESENLNLLRIDEKNQENEGLRDLQFSSDQIDEPLIVPEKNFQEQISLDTEDTDIVYNNLQREDTRESSAESVSVVIGYTAEDAFIENKTELSRTQLSRHYTIAGEDPNSIFKPIIPGGTTKNVIYEENIVGVNVPNNCSFSLDDETTENIRKKIMAYSLSEGDSDYFDDNKNNQDDFHINTVMNDAMDTSTETESTIVSAVAKIQAGARGFLTRRRLRRASGGTKSSTQETKASFGNNAISESLERLIENEAAKKIQAAYRLYSKNNIKKNSTTFKSASLEGTLAAKRLTLQRGDALQKDSNSMPEDESTENIEIRSRDKKAAMRLNWCALRQNSMPVQIDCEILRVVPKHKRRRVRSAQDTQRLPQK